MIRCDKFTLDLISMVKPARLDLLGFGFQGHFLLEGPSTRSDFSFVKSLKMVWGPAHDPYLTLIPRKNLNHITLEFRPPIAALLPPGASSKQDFLELFNSLPPQLTTMTALFPQQSQQSFGSPTLRSHLQELARDLSQAKVPEKFRDMYFSGQEIAQLAQDLQAESRDNATIYCEGLQDTLTQCKFSWWIEDTNVDVIALLKVREEDQD